MFLSLIMTTVPNYHNSQQITKGCDIRDAGINTKADGPRHVVVIFCHARFLFTNLQAVDWPWPFTCNKTLDGAQI